MLVLSYISADIINNPYRGGLEIKVTTERETVGSATAIKIRRKEHGASNYEDIYEREVSTISDLAFDLFDITTMSGKSYLYQFVVMSGTSTQIEAGNTEEVECWFDGLFVGNFETQYIAGTNFKTDTKRNMEVNYVTTLGSRVPYRVANALTNYTTGSSEGLFLQVTSDMKSFIPDYDHSYSTQVLDFLADGTGKILKTHDGQAWYISVDNQFASPYNGGFDGMNSVTFNWTEIGDVPVFGVVVD